jgi:hypothetical protein
MIAALALALAALGVPAPHHRAELAPCAGSYVIVTGDEPVGCDVRPPQRLDVAGIDRTTCDDLGGTYDAPGQCARVDY